MMHETLCGNLKSSLPSISTLLRFFQTKKEIKEGNFRFKELKKFLEESNLLNYIWVSEDATRVTGKIVYDCTTNKIVGFVQPLIDGCPNQVFFCHICKRYIKLF